MRSENQNGDFTTPVNCGTLAGLSGGGFVPSSYVLPDTTNSKFVNGAVLASTASTATIQLTGTGQAGNCQVSMVATYVAGAGNINWVPANTAVCGRTKTGVGT